ncbi:MAG: DUF2062 domain-containing protein [Nitrospirae bacterium]|nr:MAG: DUF2062 domain-containing protein [Nitrospirota bacterium]
MAASQQDRHIQRLHKPSFFLLSRATLRTQLAQVLHLQESPHRTALAFAIGVFIAFSPTYGLHALTVVFCAWAFRLNFLALLLGSLINNPWTIAPILGCTMWTGFLILGMPPPPSLTWTNLSVHTLYTAIQPYIMPFVVGACTLSLLGAALAYPLAFFVVSRYRKTMPSVPHTKLSERPCSCGDHTAHSPD